MPCVVPNCDLKGQCFGLRFPESYLLSQRWKQAIELGSGAFLPEDISPLEAEICQQHFCEFDEYGEPVIFWNNSEDCEIRLSSCRLCLNFIPSSETILNWLDLRLGGHTVDQLLKKVLRIDCSDSDSLDCSICQPCLVRLDLLASIYEQFSTGFKVWKQIQSLSKHERRIWDKISTQGKDTLAVRKASSETILCQVEMKQNEVICDDTESVVIPKYESQESFGDQQTEARKVRSNTDAGLPVISEDDNCSDKDTESTLHKERSALVKSSENRKTSSQKSGKAYVGKRKYQKRKGLPVQPKIYLNDLINRKCYRCTVVFDTTDELQDHLLDHRDEDMVCGDCSECFTNLSSFNRHLARHDPTERPLQCSHCSLRYNNAKALHIHKARVHHIDHGGLTEMRKTRDSLPCQYCGRVFRNFTTLRSHENSHMGIKPYKCKHCDTAFNSRTNLERHCMRKHTSVKPFKCGMCGNVFRKSTSYEQHRKSCNPESIRAMIENGNPGNSCRFCSDEFQQHSELIDHIVQHHPNEKVIFMHCNLCTKRFTEQYHYALHLQKHSNGKRKKHNVTYQQGVRKYVCEQCSKAFSCLSNLIRHQRLHTGLKSHQCHVCGKGFVQSAQLRVHLLIHLGEKPFECKSCGKSFADPSTLSRHRKNVCKHV